MRRAALITVVALVAAGASSAFAGSSEPAPHRVMVRGVEFDLVLSKPKLRPGRAIVQFVNAGEDPHDLKLQRLGTPGHPDGVTRAIGVVGSGEYANLDTRLRERSTYRLWCSLADHAQKGMETTLRTKPRRR